MENWLVSLAVIGSLAVVPCVYADAGTSAGVGAWGGALIGSVMGPHKNRGENTLIGAAVGGLVGYAVGNEAEKQGRLVGSSPQYGASSYVSYAAPARVVPASVVMERSAPVVVIAPAEPRYIVVAPTPGYYPNYPNWNPAPRHHRHQHYRGHEGNRRSYWDQPRSRNGNRYRYRD